MADKDARLTSIQYLRAAAALAVIVYHALGQIEHRTGYSAPWQDLGAAGVDLFFIVSGFVMWRTAIDRNESVSRFALKRIVRIVPLYWLITTFVLGVVLVAPELMRSASRDFAHFAASYAFIAWPHPILEGHYWPAVVPGWTLNYEMLFYLVVAVSLALGKRYRVGFIAAVLVSLVTAGYVVQPNNVLAFYTDPILLEFLFGVGVGVLMTRAQPFSPRLGYGLMIAGGSLFLIAGTVWGMEASRALTFGVPLAILVIGALSVPTQTRSPVSRFFEILGDASYSIYLIQFITIAPVAAVLIRVYGHLNVWLAHAVFCAGILVTATATGVCTYYLVEKPILRLSKDWLKAKPVRSASPGLTAEW